MLERADLRSLWFTKIDLEVFQLLFCKENVVKMLNFKFSHVVYRIELTYHPVSNVNEERLHPTQTK